MNTIEILRAELGDDRVKKLEENALLMLVEWSMIQYHETKVKNLNIPCVMPPLLSMNFKQMRKATGLTLRQVEVITNISNAYLSQLETGKIKSPGYDTIKKLYDLYSNGA
jgi:hypothetical protein